MTCPACGAIDQSRDYCRNCGWSAYRATNRQVRRPQDDVCPRCGGAVERAEVSGSKSGLCVVLWPCRDVFALDAT